MTSAEATVSLKDWIRAAGYSRNPFRALHAEDDPYLEVNFTPHAGYFQEYEGASSAIILGPRGSGKTANCRKLAEALRARRDRSNLVLVYDARIPWQREPDLEAPSLRHHLHYILRLGVRQLLEEVGTTLSQRNERKLRKMDDWSQIYHGRANYLSRLEVVQQIAHETGYDAVYLLIDERNGAEREPAKALTLLAPLLDASFFDLPGWIIKLFLPQDLTEAARELRQDTEMEIEIVQLRWSEVQLAELLRVLLREAWQSGPVPIRAEELSRLAFSLKEADWQKEVDRRFVNEVVTKNPTPRGLVSLGQVLFSQCARHWTAGEMTSITPEHWVAAVQAWDQALAAEDRVEQLPTLIRIRVLFLRCTDREADVHISASSAAKTTRLSLPFNRSDLWVVLGALQQFALGRWEPDPGPQVETLRRLDLLDSSSDMLAPDLLERVGDRVYDSLFEKSGLVRFLEREEAEAERLRREGMADVRLWIEVSFSQETADLARVPWELLRREELFLVKTEDFVISRYHETDDREAELGLRRPLGLLYVAPRAAAPDLPRDRPRIEEAFRSSDFLEIHEAVPASLERLSQKASVAQVQVFHFDGHGNFGHRCAGCQKILPPWVDGCCDSAPLIPPSGYLLFDDEEGRGVLHDASDVLHTLYSSARYGGLQFAMVNACKSSSQDATSSFGGVAAALVRAGFPAVVGMLTSINDRAVEPFVIGLYRVLNAALESRNLPGQVAARVFLQAVSTARRQMMTEGDELARRSWWIPTLNLRYRSGEEI